MSLQLSPKVTILHVSDMQFGDHHRFGEGIESLSSRLIQDLERLSDTIPPIDLIVLSGDLAERGMRPEFLQATDFVKQLVSFTHLNPSRVVVVPGNHDINRKAQSRSSRTTPSGSPTSTSSRPCTDRTRSPPSDPSTCTGSSRSA